VSGCARSAKQAEITTQTEITTYEDVVELVQQARERFQIIEKLGAEKTYPNDFVEAQIELVNAQNYLEAEHARDAYLSAMKSIRASQQILEQYYLDTVAALAKHAKTEIQEITRKDSKIPLKQSISQLDEIAEYAERVESGQQLVDFNKVIEDLNQVAQIIYNLREIMAEIEEIKIGEATVESEVDERRELGLTPRLTDFEIDKFESIVNEAKTLQSYVEKLEDHKTEIKENTYQKLLREYNSRKTNIFREAEFVSIRTNIEQELQDMISKRTEFASKIEHLNDELEEVKVRHLVGELTDAMFSEREEAQKAEIAEWYNKTERIEKFITRYQELLDAEKKLNSLRKDLQEEKLKIDVFFHKGKYNLSDKGKDTLKKFNKKIIANKENYVDLFPGEPVTIAIKTVGYADLLGFRKGTDLVWKLAEGVENKLPQREPDRKQFLNQRLSEFRARTINDYIKQFLLQSETGSSLMQIYQQSIGRGEEMPPELPPPYPIRDPRRRISKIYAIIQNSNIIKDVW